MFVLVTNGVWNMLKPWTATCYICLCVQESGQARVRTWVCVNTGGSAFTHRPINIALSQTRAHKARANNATWFKDVGGLKELLWECVLMDWLLSVYKCVLRSLFLFSVPAYCLVGRWCDKVILLHYASLFSQKRSEKCFLWNQQVYFEMFIEKLPNIITQH